MLSQALEKDTVLKVTMQIPPSLLSPIVMICVSLSVCVYVHVGVCTYVHACTYVCMYVRTYVCMISKYIIIIQGV